MEEARPLIELFINYLQDRCSPEEVRRLLEHFDQDENEAILKDLIRAELEFTLRGDITHSSENTVLEKVKSALLQKIRQQPRQAYLPRWFRIAAIWALILAPLAYITLHFYADRKAIQPVKYFTAVTRVGERKLVTLTDGTKIWLSPSSTLGYPDQLIGQFREVKLEGEAFFEVAKDKAHPFIIHSGRMATRVVGTSFTIQAYKSQHAATVTVVTGIVRVTIPGRVVELHPDQQSRWDRQRGTLIAASYPAAKEMLQRKDGILHYNGAPVREVVADLARYYPVRLSTTARNCLCYGEFDTNRPAGLVLEQLAAAINARVVVQQDRYLLQGGCSD